MEDGWKRTVSEMNSNGTVGVSIPKEAANDHNINSGDKVVINEADDDSEATFELHFKTDE